MDSPVIDDLSYRVTVSFYQMFFEAMGVQCVHRNRA